MSTKVATWTVAGLLALAPLASAPSALAQAVSPNQPIAGISVTTRVTADGTITAIDAANRMVTVRTSDGRTVRGKVSEAVGGLSDVKVGDRIEAALRQTMNFVLLGPNARTPADRMQSRDVVASGGGAPPAGVMATTATATWIVTAVDTARNTISMVDPAGGRVESFDVETAEGRSQLPKVKPGDKLTVSLVEHIFAAVVKK